MPAPFAKEIPLENLQKESILKNQDVSTKIIDLLELMREHACLFCPYFMGIDGGSFGPCMGPLSIEKNGKIDIIVRYPDITRNCRITDNHEQTE